MANAFVRDASSEGGPGDPTQATPFAVIQLLGLIFLTIIFATAVFAPSVKRSTPWFSLFIGWIISSTSYNLLFFAQQQLGPDPAFSLCVTQGALIHSVPILQSGTVLSLMIHAWMFISIQLRRAGHAPKYQEVINTFLLLHPYTLSLTAFIGFFGVRNPETVARDSTGVYCNIFYHRIPSTVTAVIGAFLMLVALFFEGTLRFLGPATGCYVG
ncbi:hypothetical protein ONZ45_g3299 [Pleurotus djamor]|nr:hypothetical protein ONZ45_g3299 [Pleurotus djamor]